MIRINLGLSYEQRIQKNDDALRFIHDLKIAGGALAHAESRQSTRSTLKRQD